MILKNRQVIIMQGLSGSGKTHWANKNYPNATVVSADKYFTRDGEYKFDPKLLNKAHSWCLRRFIDALDRGDTTIIVDNTNTEKWEWYGYAKLAGHWGYKWGVADLYDGPAGLTDDQLAEKNIHGVPAEAIARQRERYSRARKEELICPTLLK